MTVDAVRLAVGTLTLLPVSPPRQVQRSTWRTAIALAPAVGLVVGALAWGVGWAVREASESTFFAAVSVVGAVAILTRGLHLDGLADVADGLGSRRAPEEAQAIMRRSDIGPFGVTTLIVTLFVQVAAVQVLFVWSDGTVTAVAVIGSAVVSRAVLSATCRRGVPAAPSGLGAQVVGSLGGLAAALVVGVSAGSVVIAGLLIDVNWAKTFAMAALGALAIGELWRRHCVHRLGVVTGDVLGSVEQLAWTAFLVLAALAA